MWVSSLVHVFVLVQIHCLDQLLYVTMLSHLEQHEIIGLIRFVKAGMRKRLLNFLNLPGTFLSFL